MDFDIPADIQRLLHDIDDFIDAEIKPLQAQDDNERFFDYRREYARTDFENGGVPRKDWEDLLAEMRRRADKAGFLRWALPARYGGKDGTNLGMAIIREHLAAKGLGLHNDLQNESSVVGNFPTVKMWENYGSPAQQEQFLGGMFTGQTRVAFGLTEPKHGSDASWLETKAIRDGDDWLSTGRSVSTAASTTPPTTSSSPVPRATKASPRASAASSCRQRQKASRSILCGGL